MDLDDLVLDLVQLRDIALTLESRIAEGMAAQDRQIKALPAFIRPPAGPIGGQALVVDAGGTNLRAAWVTLEGGRLRFEAGPLSVPLPVRGEGSGLDGEGLWTLQADLVQELSPPSDLPLGYCFSYPSTSHDDGDATLITWTKGVEIEGVEGRRVGAPLAEALKARGLGPKQMRVLNDTVAALMGAALAAKSPKRCIGLICGTGTNMASFFAADRIAKLQPNPGGLMAVNLESGNFHPPHLAAVDDEFDENSERPQTQRFEKAVSGYALPHLMARLCPEAGLLPSEGTAAVVSARAQGSDRVKLAAERLLDRSADMIAAGLFGLSRAMGGSEPITVMAEGGLFWKAPGYAQRVTETLARLSGRPNSHQIERTADVNLLGSAAAALMPS